VSEGGGVFQTFYLMFKSNAKEAAKDAKKLNETLDETTKKTKKNKEEANELGKAFTNAVENATRAIAAYASFQALKNGAAEAQKLNRQLNLQAGLWGKSANEVAAYGNAVQKAGGNAEEFYGWYNRLQHNLAANGAKAMDPSKILDQLHNMVRGLDPAAAERLLDAAGLPEGVHPFVRLDDDAYAKAKTAAAELAKNTEAAGPATKEFAESWAGLTQSLTNFFTVVDKNILPTISSLLKAITDVVNIVSGSDTGAVAGFLALGATGLAFSAAIPAIVAGFGSLSAAALAAAVPIAALLAQFALLVGVATALPSASQKGGRAIGHWINRQLGRGDANGILPGHDGYGAGNIAGGAGWQASAMKYLMDKHGLDANHAAAIVANMQHESGGNPNAIGDGGLARGAFQWHPDRQAKILAGTGIDVKNASLDKQMDAAMWELGQRGQLAGFLGQGSAGDAGAYFSQRFEAPAGGLSEAMKRGRTAMNIAGSTSFASQGGGGGSAGGNSVSIGKIDVHTQATDADGIAQALNGSIQHHIGDVFAQNNDAIDR